MGAGPFTFLFTLLTPLKKWKRNVVCLAAALKDLQGKGVGLEGRVEEDSPLDIDKAVGDPNSVPGICLSALHRA